MVMDNEEMYKAFVAAYITKHLEGDKHSYFAKLLRITRDEAKLLCYKISYKGATDHE